MDRDSSHAPWHLRWKEGRLGFHRDEVHPMLEYFWSRLGLRGDERVFVPLCGKSLDMRWLVDRGHTVLGVELSEIAARDFFAEWGVEAEVGTRDAFVVYAGGGVEILVGDVFDLDPVHLGDVRAFYDRASVVALDPVTRRRYAAHLGAVLAPGAQGLLIGLESMQPDELGPPFSVPQREVRELFERDFERETLLEPDPEAAPEVRALFEHVHRLTRRG